MTRYYKECETCTEDMQRAYCSYCEKPLAEVTEEVNQREKQHEAMQRLLERFTQLRLKRLLEQCYGSDNLLTIVELPAIQEEAKALLESMKTGVK